MGNNVTPFPLDPKRRVTFRIGGREHVLIIPPIPLARRPNRAEVIPIFNGARPAGVHRLECRLACIHGRTEG